VGDVLEHVEPGDGLRLERPSRVRFGLLEDGGQDVTRLHFEPLGALHVEHRRLQHAAERSRLFGFPLLPAPHRFDRRLEVIVEVLAQAGEVGPARRQDALAFLIVRQRVEQVLEREIGVFARNGLAVGDGQDDF